MKNCIKITIQIASGEEGEILMASLADSNYYAFEFDKDELVAYISEEDFNESISSKSGNTSLSSIFFVSFLQL